MWGAGSRGIFQGGSKTDSTISRPYYQREMAWVLNLVSGWEGSWLGRAPRLAVTWPDQIQRASFFPSRGTVRPEGEWTGSGFARVHLLGNRLDCPQEFLSILGALPSVVVLDVFRAAPWAVKPHRTREG